MTQAEGIYDFALYLGGKQVVTPLVDVQPCSNAFAAELGLLAPAGATFTIDPLTYLIGAEQESIDLHKVVFFCNHTPI